MSVRTFLAAVVSSCLVASPAWAKHWHDDSDHYKKHAHHDVDDDDRDDGPGEHCYFRPHDVRIVSEYYAPQYRSLPPGLAKKYARTGQLPPGWQKKVRPLPVAVEQQLVVLPKDCRRGVIDGYVVVYRPRTQIIIDVVALFGPS